MICNLCPRACGARREEDSGAGFCGAGTRARVARAALHCWEEPCISGTRGSGAVFFTGCCLRCVYCQNARISRGDGGEPVTPVELAGIYRRLVAAGAHNINLVNPTHYLPAIAQSMDLWERGVPVVYNTGGYERRETVAALRDFVNVYLPDLKYGDDGLAAKYSGAADYFEVATEAILAMAEQAGPPVFDREGLLQSGLVVRHLVLPGHVPNSRRVLDWIAANLKGRALVSLMCQYVPCGEAGKYPRINRRLYPGEYRRVLEHLYALGLEEGYVQELGAADRKFIPDFDGTGVRG